MQLVHFKTCTCMHFYVKSYEVINFNMLKNGFQTKKHVSQAIQLSKQHSKIKALIPDMQITEKKTVHTKHIPQFYSALHSLMQIVSHTTENHTKPNTTHTYINTYMVDICNKKVYLLEQIKGY